MIATPVPVILLIRALRAMDDERLIHMKEVFQHYTVCCLLLDNLQAAHSMQYKACQLAQQLPWMSRPLRLQLEQSCKEQATIVRAVAEYRAHLVQVVDSAQRELLVPVIYSREDSFASDEDEELRDIRANVFTNHDW